MLEADSQNFASAPSAPRGFTLKNFRPAFGHGTIGGPWEEGGPQPPPPQNPPPPPLPKHLGCLNYSAAPRAAPQAGQGMCSWGAAVAREAAPHAVTVTSRTDSPPSAHVTENRRLHGVRVGVSALGDDLVWLVSVPNPLSLLWRVSRLVAEGSPLRAGGDFFRVILSPFASCVTPPVCVSCTGGGFGQGQLCGKLSCLRKVAKLSPGENEGVSAGQ